MDAGARCSVVSGQPLQPDVKPVQPRKIVWVQQEILGCLWSPATTRGSSGITKCLAISVSSATTILTFPIWVADIDAAAFIVVIGSWSRLGRPGFGDELSELYVICIFKSDPGHDSSCLCFQRS